jgi:3-deoxy-D-arabino-heptulosonate 7-phosphate (DAHP) synthase
MYLQDILRRIFIALYAHVPPDVDCQHSEDEKKEHEKQEKVHDLAYGATQSDHNVLQVFCGFEDAKGAQNAENSENAQYAQDGRINVDDTRSTINQNANKADGNNKTVELAPAALEVARGA